MSTQLKEKINISVDNIETLTDVDLADLCNITEQAIKAGGGFGWLRVPTRDILTDYWTKRSNDKYIKLIVGRLNGVIAAIKWGGVLNIGESKMKEIIAERKNL